jgi:RNase P/RNase MRP subunit p29
MNHEYTEHEGSAFSDGAFGEPGAVADPDAYTMREETRVETRKMRCSHGRVVDLTGRGMRIVLDSKDAPIVGQSQIFVFSGEDTEIRVQGIVRWVRHTGGLRRRTEAGVEFMDLLASQRDALRRYAVVGELEEPNAALDNVRIEYPDLYAIMGVSPLASFDEIRRAYHKLVRRWHPDVCDEEDASERMSEIHKAYKVLRDEDLRAQYDERFGPLRGAA